MKLSKSIVDLSDFNKNTPRKKFKTNNTVVQDNTLITAHHKMNRNELLAFKQMISQVDIESKSRSIQLTKEEIVKFIFPSLKNDKTHDIDHKYYKSCKKYCSSLVESSIIISEIINNKKNTSFFNIISAVYWKDYSNVVTIKFSEDIMPLIYELKKSFTQYHIGYLPKLKSKHSIRLYEYYKMKFYNHNKIQQYTWEESLYNLRMILGLQNKYNNIDNFKSRILKKTQQEINEHTDIHIKYTPLKNTDDGKTVTDIKFTITLNKKYATKSKSPSKKAAPAKKQIEKSITPVKELFIPEAGPGREFLEKTAAKKQITVEELLKQKNTVIEKPQPDIEPPVINKPQPKVKKESLWNKIKSKFKH